MGGYSMKPSEKRKVIARLEKLRRLAAEEELKREEQKEDPDDVELVD